MPKPSNDDERRDAVLRRMLATPKPGKGDKKTAGKAAGAERPANAGRKPTKAED